MNRALVTLIGADAVAEVEAVARKNTKRPPAIAVAAAVLMQWKANGELWPLVVAVAAAVLMQWKANGTFPPDKKDFADTASRLIKPRPTRLPQLVVADAAAVFLQWKANGELPPLVVAVALTPSKNDDSNITAAPEIRIPATAEETAIASTYTIAAPPTLGS